MSDKLRPSDAKRLRALAAEFTRTRAVHEAALKVSTTAKGGTREYTRSNAAAHKAGEAVRDVERAILDLMAKHFGRLIDQVDGEFDEDRWTAANGFVVTIDGQCLATYPDFDGERVRLVSFPASRAVTV